MIQVSEYASEGTILPDLRAGSTQDALRQLVRTLTESGAVRRGEELLDALQKREEIMTTGLGGGIAIPHAWANEVTRVGIAVGRAREGIDFRALDGKPVNLVFLLASPEEDPWLHLQILARISRLARMEELRGRLLQALSSREMYQEIVAAERVRP